MIAPPSFDSVRAPVARVAGWLVLLMMALLLVPSAFAGDLPDLDTFILTGPDAVTASTSADFTFRSSDNNRDPEFWCALDDEDYAPCHDGTWHREGITPGMHVFWVYSHDKQTGRVDGTPASWEWMVEEATPPLDAGSPGGDAGTGADGGPTAGDAGPGEDGGSPGADAGTGGNDGGSTAGDAGPEEDGGPSGGDAGTGGNDGGPAGSDAGTGDGDGGTPAEDGGTSDEDGGVHGDGGPPGPVPPGDVMPPDALDYLGGGMGCTGAPAPGAMTGLLLLVLALRRQRR